MIWKSILEFLGVVVFILLCAAFGYIILTQIGRP